MDSYDYCIAYLAKWNRTSVPTYLDKPQQLRALSNVTMPEGLSEEFYREQDKALSEERKKKGEVDGDSLPFLEPGICLFRGDITRLKVGAIVNACNEQMLGCFVPLHNCVDNCIHSAAGLQVRRDMMAVMKEQGHEEPNGQCKVTKGYNLPCAYIFHTVAPKAGGHPSKQDREDLASCYATCLAKAEEMGLSSIAFCSLGTGIYGFPIREASRIAIEQARKFLLTSVKTKRVIFDVFSENDYETYLRNFEN